MNLTDEDVEEILRLLAKSSYTELRLTTDRFSLQLKAGSSCSEAPKSAGAQDGARIEIAAAVDQAAAPKPPATSATTAGEMLEIYPPLPGTFYRAPSPGATPFTEVGQIIEPDSILGLVETMKLMNSVVAGCHGEVVEICIDNGKLVEVGDVLLRIRVTEDG